MNGRVVRVQGRRWSCGGGSKDVDGRVVGYKAVEGRVRMIPGFGGSCVDMLGLEGSCVVDVRPWRVT